MSDQNFPCIYPLVESSLSPYVSIGNTSCGVSCGDGKNFFLIFTREEDEMLKKIRFVVSLIAVSLTPLYVFIAVSEQRRFRRSCLKLPFVYQCPFFISGGYISLCVIALCPFLFGPSLICNSEDNTLTIDSFRNIPCTLTAIGIYMGVRLAIFYTCALSVSLALTLYYPNFVQRKLYFHLIVWTTICLGIIPLVMVVSITGDFNFGVCTTSLTSRENLLMSAIIPFLSCICIFSVCILLATIKVCRHNVEVAHLLHVDKDISSFIIRLLLYNILQTTAVVIIVGDFCYWYINLDAWNETRKATFWCGMGKTKANQTSPDDYQMCISETADLPRPQLWTYYILEFCALISVLGAIVFQCSLRVQNRYINSLRNAALSLCKSNISSTTPTRDQLPMGFRYSSSYTDMKREEITDTAVISSLDSTTSICRAVKPPSERRVI